MLFSGAYEAADCKMEFVPAVSRNVIDNGAQDSISTDPGYKEPLAIKVNLESSHRIILHRQTRSSAKTAYAALSTLRSDAVFRTSP